MLAELTLPSPPLTSTAPPAPKPPRAIAWRRYALNALGVLVVGAVVYGAVVYGLRLRNALFADTASIRFRADVTNGYRWGGRVVTDAQTAAKVTPGSTAPVTWPQFFRAFVDFYNQFDEMDDDANYRLDYSPARLLVMSVWAKHVRETFPDSRVWRDEMTWPLLHFNTSLEAVGAVAMFGVVLLWKRRGGAGGWNATIVALVASLVFWFNPAILLDAHTWPQWDVWLIPFFLLALLLASLDWFFVAGAMIAVGASLKGQMLMGGLPVLMLWPLMGGRVGAAARGLLGFLFAAALGASPWLVPTEMAWKCVGAVVIAAIVAIPLVRVARRLIRWRWSPDTILSAVVFASAALRQIYCSPAPYNVVGFTAITILAAPLVLPRRAWPFWIAAASVGAIYLSSEFFDGSWAWFKVGYAYPTRHYEAMFLGRASNLSGILSRTYHWGLFSPVTLPFNWDVFAPLTRPFNWEPGSRFAALPDWNSQPVVLPVKLFLPILYGITVVLCAIGAAIHSRRNDPRTLVALTAPWVLMFALMPKMHERYLIWAAATCGVGLATSVGLGVLHLVVIALATLMIFHPLLDREVTSSGTSWPRLLEAFNGTHPNIGWMTVFLALIYLYQALRITPRGASKLLSAAR